MLNGQEYSMMYSVFEWKEKNVEISKNRDKDNEQNEHIIAKVIDGKIILPATAGYYMYEVIGQWNEGEVSFIFDIELY